MSLIFTVCDSSSFVRYRVLLSEAKGTKELFEGVGFELGWAHQRCSYTSAPLRNLSQLSGGVFVHRIKVLNDLGWMVCNV